MTETEIIDPTESQQLYEYVLNNNTKLPPSMSVRNMILTTEQLKEIYDIVATNRAKTKGTRLYLEVSNDGQVSKIEYAEIKVPPEEIITPRFKECPDCNKQFDNVLDRCPKCGKTNER